MLINKNLYYSKIRKKMSILLIEALIIFIFLNIFFVIIADEAEAGMAIVKIELPGKIEPAEVGLAKSGVVRYEGNVILDRFPTTQQQVVVNLYADAGGEGWGASISPPIIVIFPGQRKQNFTLNVVAPPRESTSVQKQVTIGGNWQTFPGIMTGEVEGTSVIVPVKRFSLFIIIPKKDYVKTWPTETAEFELSILNQGNAEETFIISILDYENLVVAGYSVELETNAITVDERSEGSFKFKVRGSQKNFNIWKSHQTSIPLHIVTDSSASEKAVERDWTCMYYEVGFYMPEPCIFGIIIGIVIITTIIWAKKKNRLFWKKRRKSPEGSN